MQDRKKCVCVCEDSGFDNGRRDGGLPKKKTTRRGPSSIDWTNQTPTITHPQHQKLNSTPPRGGDATPLKTAAAIPWGRRANPNAHSADPAGRRRRHCWFNINHHPQQQPQQQPRPPLRPPSMDRGPYPSVISKSRLVRKPIIVVVVVAIIRSVPTSHNQSGPAASCLILARSRVRTTDCALTHTLSIDIHLQRAKRASARVERH